MNLIIPKFLRHKGAAPFRSPAQKGGTPPLEPPTLYDLVGGARRKLTTFVKKIQKPPKNRQKAG